MGCVQGVFEHLHAKGIKAPEPVGLQVMVHGVVPLGGLHSCQLNFVQPDFVQLRRQQLHSMSAAVCWPQAEA